jgi:Leucine-rich repeat (LRR) protein
MATIRDKRPGNNMRVYGANELYFANLKALKSLAPLPPIVPDLTTVKIFGLDALTSLEGLEKSQHLEKLVLTKSAIQDFSSIAQLPNLKEIECDQCDGITDASALGVLTQLEKVTFTKCQNLETMPSGWKSAVKALSLSDCPALKPLESLPPGLDKKKIEISDRKLLPREKPIQALKSDMRSVWKLLSSRDVANVRMGLLLSEALTSDLDDLVADVSVKNGELKRGKRFDGTGPAQPYLDIALFGLMAVAAKGSKLAKLRQEPQTLSVSLTTESPDLKGFENIETLTLLILDDTTPDLINFGTLPTLRTLKLNGGGWNSTGQLLSLNGLDAPSLEEVRLNGAGLVEVEAFSKSPLLKTLDLSENKKLSSLEGISASAATLVSLNLQKCETLESIEPVGDLTHLKEIYLADCASLKSVEALGKIKTLTKLTLESCRALLSLKGIEDLALEMPKSYGGAVLSLSGCSSLTTLKHFPKNPVSVDRLDLSYMKALKSLEHLPQLPAVKSLFAYSSGFEDISAIRNLPNLESVSLSNCNTFKNVECLGKHANLKEVTLSSTAVEKLPHEWQAPLEDLDMSQTSSLADLGQLPASLKQLNIKGCEALKTLKGIEGCTALAKLNAYQCDQLTSLEGLQHSTQLEELYISMQVTDHAALINLKNTKLHIEIPSNISIFPEEWLASINQLQDSELYLHRISHLFGMSAEKSKFDYNQLSLLQNAKSLNFEGWDFLLNYDEMGWVLDMPNLQSLRFTQRGRMAYRMGSSVYDDLKKLRKLQETICTEGSFTRPAFLIAHD